MLFKVCGVIAILSILVPKYGIWLVVLPIALASMYLVGFSYTEYRKQG